MGGGRIGAATSDEVVDDVVAVEQEDDVEAFRVMAGIEPDGRRGKGGWGEGVEVGVGMGEGCIVVAMSSSDYKVNTTFSTTKSCCEEERDTVKTGVVVVDEYRIFLLSLPDRSGDQAIITIFAAERVETML